MIQSPLILALRRLRRGWRSGELLILSLSLMIAVAAASAVGSFTERVREAIARQSGETMGADVVITSRDPLPPPLRASIAQIGLRTADKVEFPSVALYGDNTQLVSVKAVSNPYPLRGQLRLATEPFGSTRNVVAAPPPGEAWVDLRLWQDFGLSQGVVLQLGQLGLRVGAILDYEPNRGGSFSDLSPTVLINQADLAQTGLVGEGSRVQYTLLLAGEPAQIDALKSVPLPAGARRITPDEAQPQLREALARAGRFLDIAVLAVTLLSAAAIALSALQHGIKQRDEVALLKCLGASRSTLTQLLSLQLLLLGLVAGLAGAVLGFGAQFVLERLMASLLDVTLPPPSWLPALTSWALGLAVLMGFALPPVLAARNTPPIRVFQRAAEPRQTPWIAVTAVLAVALLLWWQAGEAKLAAYVFGGALGTCAVLAAVALLLVKALTPLRQAGGMALRFGLGNIARRRGATVAQAVALGLALLALLLVSVVRTDLLEAWKNRLPPDTPNQFLINIQPQQLEPLKTFFRERGYADLTLWPMARARLVALNGKPVTAESFDDPETRRWINREFNVSWADGFGADNELLSGQWWTPQDRGQPWLSVDDYAVERLKLKVGDRLSLQLADHPVELTVHNTRRVNWESFRPNFFLVTPPGVLDQAPAQWITSFYLPKDQRALLRDLIHEFPNITAFDIDATMNQVRSIVDRIVRAVEFIFLFTLAAGAMVLLAAIQGTRTERMRETALLRTLGARTRTIAAGLLAEYATLGITAGLVAAAAAQLLAWILARQVFDIPYGPRPLLWLIGAGSGALLVTALGALSMRSVLNAPPALVLKAG